MSSTLTCGTHSYIWPLKTQYFWSRRLVVWIPDSQSEGVGSIPTGTAYPNPDGCRTANSEADHVTDRSIMVTLRRVGAITASSLIGQNRVLLPRQSLGSNPRGRTFRSRGCSSVGRAPGLQPGCRGFEACHLHNAVRTAAEPDEKPAPRRGWDYVWIRPERPFGAGFDSQYIPIPRQ